jgi:hypothetical protein
MGSDCPRTVRQAQGFSVNISVKTPADAERIFGALSPGGTVTMPLSETFWVESVRDVRGQVRNSVDDQLRAAQVGRSKETAMKVMVIVKASQESEAGKLPSAQLLQDMGKFKRGAREGRASCWPAKACTPLEGKRVRFSARTRTWSTAPSPKPRNSSPASGSGR